MDIFQFPGISGLPGILLTLVAMVIYGFYIQRNAKSKAEEVARNSYEKAIKAQQVYNDVLEKRLEDVEQELRAIHTALKQSGMHLTVDGKIEHVYKAEQE